MTTFWVGSGPGSVESRHDRPEEFFNTDDTQRGAQHIMTAAKDYIIANFQYPVTDVAIYLMEEDGPGEDLYQWQSRTRWHIDTEVYTDRAKAIVELIL